MRTKRSRILPMLLRDKNNGSGIFQSSVMEHGMNMTPFVIAPETVFSCIWRSPNVVVILN